jgi:hypothetical protein
MKYFNLEAEVAGGFGPHSVTHEAPGELIVHRLHFIFDGWLGDEIVESTPCYLVTEDLANTISARGLTGASFDQAEIGCSDIFKELYPGKSLPAFVWMKVCGTKMADDFFFAGYGRLVVSERALEVIRPRASHAVITNFTD